MYYVSLIRKDQNLLATNENIDPLGISNKYSIEEINHEDFDFD